MYSAVEFARQGAAGLALHYLGDPTTESEIMLLKEQLQSDTLKIVVIPGDIARRETSTEACTFSKFISVLNTLQIVNKAVSAFERIDVLVSNAGICPFADFLTMPPETWSRTREVNLDGSFYIVQGDLSCCVLASILLLFQAVANQMKRQIPQGGSIIGISSISALVGGEQQWSVVSSQCHFSPKM